MLIEFLGTPGAGKTTLYRALVDHLRSRGYPVLAREDLEDLLARRTAAGRLAAGMPWGLARAGLLRRLAAQQAAQGRRRFARPNAELLRFVYAAQAERPAEAGVKRRRVLPQFLNMAGKVAALQSLARLDEIIMLDEAFTHRVVQFYASHVEEPDAAAVSAYLDRIPPPDVLVWVDAPAVDCLRRVQERGVWQHSRELSLEDLELFLTHAQAVTHIAAYEARRRGWRVVEVFNHRGVEEAAELMFADVERILQNNG